MRWRPLVVISLVTATGLPLAGVAESAATAPAAKPAIDPLEWGPCEEDVDDAFDCATLDVPLDYDAPAGETIPIALIRLAASSGERQGAVLFNPGGPGGSGYDVLANAGQAFVAEMAGLGAFDLIGFDPRGVDRSNGIRCLDDATVDATTYADDIPDSAAEAAASDAADLLFGSSCQEKYGDTLIHYSTENTARDMDSIRLALGDAQISYIGISYGTYLGAVYATLFPDQVRAMVLDAAFDPSGDTVEQQYLTQLLGFEEAFDNWASWCEESTECEFSGIDVGGRWDDLMARLDVESIKSDAGRPVNQVVMETATISTLYSEMSWPALGAALADAEEGDGTGLLRLADDYTGRSDDGSYDTSQQSGDVIRCASGIEQQLPDDPAALLARMQEAAPRFSRGITVDDFRDSCRDLFPDVVDAVVPSYRGNAPIVVVGGRNDPATPFRWAEELTAELGPSARLVSYSGEGHGQILNSSCVTEIEAAVIVDLTLPRLNATCDPDPEVERPEFWDQLPVPAGVGAPLDDPLVDVTLGLPPTQMYSDAWVLTGEADTVIEGYSSALEDLGFFTAPADTELIEGATILPALAPDATELVVIVVSAEGIASNEDLSDLAGAVETGEGIVVVAAFGDR